MRLIHGLAVLLTSAMLVSCGGGGGNAGACSFACDSGSGSGTGSGVSAAADLTLQLSATSVNNSGTQTVKATVTAVDSARNALTGIPVTVSVDNNAVAILSGPTTGTDGTVTATVSLGADRSNRLVTVTATSGSLVRTATFQVTGAALQATLLPVVAPSSTGNTIQYRLVDTNTNAMAAQAITVSAPGFADVTGITDTNGSFTYTYAAPATVGSLSFSAVAGGATSVKTVLVSGGSSVPAAGGAALGPASSWSASVSANPSVVSVNSATTNNRSELRALFVGLNNAPVANVRAIFTLPDPNNIGGSLSTQSNIVYSDANGVATSAYIPGSRSSPTNGVTVQVCWDVVDFVAPACPHSTTTTLTVISEALAVTIGTDNTISDGTGGLTYVKKFVVLVVDSSGQAKADVQLAASIDLISYIKGYYDGPTAWNRNAPSTAFPLPIAGAVGFTGPTCLNEDTDRNGILTTAKDINQNGQLDPRKSDVAISFVGSSKTSANGTAIVQIEYPKNVATWVDYSILISASGVLGTEGRASWTGQLPADAASFKASSPPAFVVSPYGVSAQLPSTLASNPSGGSIADGCYNKD